MAVPREMDVRHPLVKVGARAKIVIFRARVKYVVRTPGEHYYRFTRTYTHIEHDSAAINASRCHCIAWQSRLEIAI